MSITAKELAKLLGVSPTAVSLALNNKPGISRETRDTILHAAEQYNLDFSKKVSYSQKNNEIYFIAYHAFDTVLNYDHLLYGMYEGMKDICAQNHYKLKLVHVDDSESSLNESIKDIRVSPIAGIILLGTAISKNTFLQYQSLNIPMILLDSYLFGMHCSSVTMDNVQGAYLACDYLIKTRHAQPGHLRSKLHLENFNERNIGFKNALSENGLPQSKSIIHELSPSIEGAFLDMMEILENDDPLADCYFADNDLIAIGAMKAFATKGIKIPEDIGIVGFDNIEYCKVIHPALTSISVSRSFLGMTAASQLISEIQSKHNYKVNIKVATELVKRLSV